MSVPILQDGDQRLRTVSQPVPKEMIGTPELARIIADMAEALDGQEDGVAIAAPQIGFNWRIFLVRNDRVKPPQPEGEPPLPADVSVYINPEFVRTSRKRELMEEGCLSVRGKYGKVKRAERATVRALDEHGVKFERGGGGLLAQIFQHETDHLDGILFIDKAEHVRKSRKRERFAFFGTPYVARDTLAALVEAGYIPTVVITNADRPKGRGMELAPCETKAWALEYGIPVLSPEKIDETAIEAISAYGCSYAIVVAYGKILPDALIESFPKGMLNVHYSLLPKYRGASPVEGALLNGDEVTGVAIQKLVQELDAGDILAVREEKILPGDTTKSLRARLITEGVHLLVESLPAFIEGSASFTPQDHSLATRTRKIKKEAGELSLAPDTEHHGNWNKYRAYAESPGTYFFADRAGKTFRVKIKEAEFTKGEFRPLRVTPEGKPEMAFADFLAAGYVPR